MFSNVKFIAPLICGNTLVINEVVDDVAKILILERVKKSQRNKIEKYVFAKREKEKKDSNFFFVIN